MRSEVGLLSTVSVEFLKAVQPVLLGCWDCRYRFGKQCFHSACSFLDSSGNVVVCPLLPNPNGRFLPHVVKESLSPAFSKHLRSR